MKKSCEDSETSDRFIKWVKLKKYCQESGDTSHAVHAKRKKGIWIDGRHCIVAGDGNLWIHLKEVEKWVENGNRTVL